jgi:hypothetical protein
MARFSSRPLIAAALLSTVALGACATPTPYRPAVGSGQYSTGFAERQLEANRYAVTFSGNSVTSRERVERYLLFRAAELTLQNGYDWFSVVDRDTERKTDTYVDRPIGSSFGGYGYWGPGWGYWGPRWRYARRGFGWGAWGGYGYDPFFDDWSVRQIDRYEAQAEIVMGKGPKPAGDRFAFDARDVTQRLGPSIEYPGDRRQ